MTNRSKSKGTAWETKIVDFLKACGFTTARRVTLAGANDQGDIHLGTVGDPLAAIEAKNEQRMTLAGYVDEANRQAARAGSGTLGIAWVHRRGKSSPADGYVVMDGRTFARIVAALGDGAGSCMAFDPTAARP